MYKAKINYNKKTDQATVFLSKRRLRTLKDKKAKFLKIKEEDLEF